MPEAAIIDDEIAIKVGKAYAQLEEHAREVRLKEPSLSDALVVAIARKYGRKILTGDEHFEDLPEPIWMGSR